MKSLKYLILTVIFLFGFAHANESIHYFGLKNRSANEVIPILQPLLQEQEAISGDGFQLFIKTTKARAREIESILQTIDRAAKTFRISVTNDEYIAQSQNSIQGSVRIETGDAEIEVGNHRYRDEGVSIEADARTSNNQRNKIQFINVQEGKAAFLSREKARLLPVYSYVKRSYGIAVIDHGYSQYSSEDGFYVEARSSDNEHAHVTIQTVAGLDEHYRRNDYEQQFAETTLRVPFGKWFEIGGNTESSSRSSKGILYRTEEKEERYSKIFLKVEVVN